VCPQPNRTTCMYKINNQAEFTWSCEFVKSTVLCESQVVLRVFYNSTTTWGTHYIESGQVVELCSYIETLANLTTQVLMLLLNTERFWIMLCLAFLLS
jgi:hypothetical protein